MEELEVRELGELEPDSPEGREWEALAGASPTGGFMQSLRWAAFRRQLGYSVLHLGLLQGGRLVGGALCHTVEHNRGAGILVAPEGPVLPWESEELSRRGLRLLLERIERLAPDWGTMAFRIEPRVEAPKPRVLRAFRRAPVDLIPQETLYLDLTGTSQEILAGMRPKGRYNLRLAARRGVTVREELSPEAATEFYSLLAEAGDRDGFFVEPPFFFAEMAANLCPAGMGRFLFAEHEGDLLGTLFLVTYGHRATYLYGGIANRKRSLMAGYALQWAAIEAARAEGCTSYDFYGYEPTGAPSHLYHGFSRFKRQFGGRTVRFVGAHDYYFLDRLADAVVRAARELDATGRGDGGTGRTLSVLSPGS